MSDQTGSVRRFATCFAALAAISPATALAQLDEVVVTAQRRVENVQNVPVAVTAFDGAKLAEQNIARIDDIASKVPGLFIASGNSVGTTRMSIRGINTEPNNVGLGNSIPNYFDGVALGPGRTLDTGLFDLAAIEVLRGPQGTLFGRNSTGGAVLIRTNQPSTEARSGFVNLGGGNFSAKRFNGAINLPVSDGFALRFSAGLEQRDGFVRNTRLNIDQNDQDSQGVRAQALWKVNDDWRATFRADWSSDEQIANVKDFGPNAAGASAAAAARDLQVDTDQPSLTNRKTRSGNIEVVRDTGNLKFVSLTSYAWFDYFNLDDVDYTGTNLLATTAAVQQDQWSQEFRFESPQDNTLSWVAGIYYFTEDVATQNSAYGLFTFQAAMAPTPTTVLLVGSGTRKTDSYAVFGQARWKLSDTWSLTGGLRYTEEESDVNKFQPAGLALLGIPAFNNSTSVSDGEVSGTVKLQFEPTDDLMLYASASRGFKASGFNLAPGGPADYTADPEFVDAYELGLRSEWAERRVRANLTLFDYKYKDLQRSTFVAPAGGGVPTIVFGNAGRVKSRGAELELQFAPTEGLSFGGTYGYVDAEFDEYFELVGGQIVNRSGFKPSRAPKNTGSLFFDYRYAGLSAVDLTFRADYQSRSKSFALDSNATTQILDDVSIGNVRIGVGSKDGPWNVSAYVKNVGDEAYVIGTSSATGAPGVGVQMALPRTYGLDLGFRF